MALPLDFREKYELRYGDVGEYTTGIGHEHMDGAVVKVQWTPRLGGITIDDYQVVPDPFLPKKGRGMGYGSEAWRLFEKLNPAHIYRLTAGSRHWGGKWNKLACRFWLKMGFSFVRSKSGKCTGRAQRMFKKGVL